jgi:hypothetical protein
MKQKIIPMLICCTLLASCERWQEELTSPSAVTTAPVDQGTVYSLFLTPANYMSYRFFEDGRVELVAATSNNGVMDGYLKARGTYSYDATTIIIDVVIEEATANINFYCGVALPLNDPAFVKTATTMFFDNKTITLESASGLSQPDLSSFANVCP